MAKVTIRHVQAGIDDIKRLGEEGAMIRETPHMGANLVGKYALMIAGLSGFIVFVDTIKAGRDKFGQVREFHRVRLMSNDESENIPAAAANSVALSNDKLAKLTRATAQLGINLGDFRVGDTIDLVALHLHCAKAVAGHGVQVTTFAEAWRASGEIGTAMFQYMAERGLLERYHEKGGKIVQIREGQNQPDLLRHQGVYFEHDDAHGLLPPVEAMLALWAVQGVLAGRAAYDNLYRLSTVYTQDEAVLARVSDITQGTLAELGVSGTGFYGLLVADNDLLDALGGTRSQFDLLRAGERFDIGALVQARGGAK